MNSHDNVRNVLPFVAAKHHVSYPERCTREAGSVKKHDPSYRRGQSEFSKGLSGMSTPGTRVMPFVDGYPNDGCHPATVGIMESCKGFPPSYGIIDCFPYQTDPGLPWPSEQTDPPLIWPTIHPVVPPLQEPSKGYHINTIPRGQFGEASKIVEEVKEFEDAVEQGCSVMALVELADLLGAIEGYLEKHHPTIKMTDLQKMSDITKRVFKNGHRR